MGTNYLAPTWRQPENTNKDRLSNYSLYFDGSGHEIDCGTGDEVNITGPISISVWFNADNTDGARGIVCKNDAAAQQTYAQYFFDLLNNEIRWRAGKNTVSYGINTGQWYHAVGVYDGSDITLYIDGNSVATDSALSTSYASSQPLYIGRRLNQDYFEGEIGQVCIFDYAIDQDQINYLYNLNNPLTISGAEPIAYWPLGDNSNPTANAGYPNIISDADSVFEFDGSTDYIDTPQIDLGVNSSITTWYKPANNSYALFGEATSGFDYLVSQQSGSFIVWMGSAIGNIMNFGGAISSNIIFNEWNFLAIVKTGDSVTVYLNNSDGEFSSTITNVNVAGLSLKFDRIGARTLATPTLYYDGEISNILGFKTSLSSTEVSTVYNNGLPLLELSEIPQKDDLMVWYKLNQSAVLTPGTPTNWTITKIGSPNFSGTNDGSYAGTSGTSPYNSGLIWHDNNSGATVGSDYFQWNSPTIYTSGSNIVLSSSGGSWVTPSSGGNQAILEYNIDDGSWVTWHTQTNGIDGFATNNFTIPSTGNLTVSNNIKIRIKGVDFGSTGSYLKINDINATGGTSSYNESFTNATRYGFSGGGESQPPATFSADEWDIPDNRSAYPQSFNFDGVNDYILTGSAIDLGTSCSISFWYSGATSGRNGSVVGGRSFAEGGLPSNYQTIFLSAGTYLAFYQSNSATPKTFIYGSSPMNSSDWFHAVIVRDGANLNLYLNGADTSTSYTDLDATAPTYVRNIATNGENQTGSQTITGKISNVSVFNTALPATGTDSVATLYNNGVPLPTASVEPSNLKAWYKLDKPTSVWNGTNWEIGNSTSNYSTALNFDGVDDFVSIYDGAAGDGPSSLKFTSTDSFSISCWVNTVATSGQENIISFRGTPLIWLYRSSTAISFRLRGNGSGTESVITKATTNGDWHNIVAIRDYNGGSPQLKLYIDNVPATPVTDSTSGDFDTYDKFSIGNDNYNGGRYWFDGNLSNIVIWKTDQSSEISNIYNSGAPATTYTNTPTAWWKLDNTTITDSSGNGNTGTNNGATQVSSLVSTLNGTSSGMTEANLIDENVSVVNAESNTLPASALVQSDLTRKLPFSNYSVLFNGADESFNCGSLDETEGITTMSISGWFNPQASGVAGAAGIIAKETRDWYVGWYSSPANSIRFLISDDNGSTNDALNSLTLGTNADVLNKWHHFVCTWDASDKLKIYINGVLSSETNSVNANSALPTSTNNVEIGRRVATYFDGNLSNIAIWNSVLTQEEILDVYNNGVPTNLNTSFTPGQPEYWWPMDEDHTYFNGSVLIARDAVGSTDATGANVVQENIVGNAPGSAANGIGSNLTIADLKGDMQNSTNNSYSINMADYADGVTNPADSGRSTNVP